MLGERIKLVRGYYVLTQQEFAEQLEIPQTSVSKYEKNAMKPGTDMLIRIGETFGVNMNWLLLDKGEMLLTPNGSSQDSYSSLERKTGNSNESLMELSQTINLSAAFSRLGIHSGMTLKEAISKMNHQFFFQLVQLKDTAGLVGLKDILHIKETMRIEEIMKLVGVEATMSISQVIQLMQQKLHETGIPLVSPATSDTETTRNELDGVLPYNENEQEALPFPKGWINQHLPIPPHLLRWMPVEDQSMSPLFHEGDSVIFQFVQTPISSDGLYVLEYSGHLRIKRIQFLLDGHISIASEHPDYSKEKIDSNDLPQLKVIGQVVWFGKKV